MIRVDQSDHRLCLRRRKRHSAPVILDDTIHLTSNEAQMLLTFPSRWLDSAEEKFASTFLSTRTMSVKLEIHGVVLFPPLTEYERDRSVHFRYQGYRIHINLDGSRALHDCLPENLYSLFVATSSKPITGRFAVFDPQLKELFSRPLPRAEAVTNSIKKSFFAFHKSG